MGEGSPNWPMTEPPAGASIITDKYPDPYKGGQPSNVYEFTDPATGKVQFCIMGGDGKMYEFDAVHLMDKPGYEEATGKIAELGIMSTLFQMT